MNLPELVRKPENLSAILPPCTAADLSLADCIRGKYECVRRDNTLPCAGRTSRTLFATIA